MIFFSQLYKNPPNVPVFPIFQLRYYITNQPTFQHQINIASTLRINVETTLIPRWKWNKIRRRFFNVAHLWYNVGAWRSNNFEGTMQSVETTSKQRCTTLKQGCINIVLTKPQRCWNYIETNRAIEYGFINRLIIFILLNERIFLTTSY